MAWLTTTNHGVITHVRRYSQCLEAQLVPAVLVDGKPVSWRRIITNLNTVEKVTEYRGLSRTTAIGTNGNGGLCATLGSGVTTQIAAGGGVWESESHATEAAQANAADGWTVTHTQKNSSLSSS